MYRPHLKSAALPVPEIYNSNLILGKGLRTPNLGEEEAVGGRGWYRLLSRPMYGSDRRLQRRFPIDDYLVAVQFRRYSRSSRDVVQNRAENMMFWGHHFLGDPQIC